MDANQPTSQTEVPYPKNITRFTPPEDGSLLAFSVACSEGSLERVRELIEGKNRPVGYLNHGFPNAVLGGHKEVTLYLLARGAVINGIVAQDAVYSNSVEMLRLLVDYGWNVKAAEEEGVFLIPYAIENETVLRWLLDQGADPNLGTPVWTNSTNGTRSGEGLNTAASLSNITAFDLLLERGAKLEYAAPLHFATCSNKPDAEAFAMMKHLLELGVDINGMDETQGPFGRGTPLHYAAGTGRLTRVHFLMENGADPQISRLGRRPVDDVRKYHEKDVLSFFEGGS